MSDWDWEIAREDAAALGVQVDWFRWKNSPWVCRVFGHGTAQWHRFSPTLRADRTTCMRCGAGWRGLV